MGLDVAHPPIHGCHDLIAPNTFKFFLQFCSATLSYTSLFLVHPSIWAWMLSSPHIEIRHRVSCSCHAILSGVLSMRGLVTSRQAFTRHMRTEPARAGPSRCGGPDQHGTARHGTARVYTTITNQANPPRTKFLGQDFAKFCKIWERDLGHDSATSCHQILQVLPEFCNIMQNLDVLSE